MKGCLAFIITWSLVLHDCCPPTTGQKVECTFGGGPDYIGQGVLLKNAAKEGLCMPIVGIGTGHCNAVEGGECMNNTTTEKAVLDFITAGGRRIDSALTYPGAAGAGRAIQECGLPREGLFITSKIGPGAPLGYTEAKSTFNEALETLNTTYVDLLLIHWPGPPGNSSDPFCRPGLTSYSKCRQSTWKALEEIYHSGKALAIGVSNFEINHLEDIFEMESLLPSVNQVEFHPYWHEDELVAYCQNRSIVFNGYSPMASNDWAPTFHHWPTPLLSQPILQKIATAKQRSVGQVALRWQWQQGIVVNPRTQTPLHMEENTQIFNFELTAEEMKEIASIQAPPNPKVFKNPHDIP